MYIYISLSLSLSSSFLSFFLPCFLSLLLSEDKLCYLFWRLENLPVKRALSYWSLFRSRIWGIFISGFSGLIPIQGLTNFRDFFCKCCQAHRVSGDLGEHERTQEILVLSPARTLVRFDGNSLEAICQQFLGILKSLGLVWLGMQKGLLRKFPTHTHPPPRLRGEDSPPNSRLSFLCIQKSSGIWLNHSQALQTR